MKAIPKAYSVEIPLPAQLTLGTKVNFPDIPYLRKKKIIGIEANTTDTVSICPSGANNITSTQYAQSFLTLQEANNGGQQFVVQQPTLRFVPFYYGGIWLEFVPKELDVMKCYIEFVANSTAPANGQSAYFTFYYLD